MLKNTEKNGDSRGAGPKFTGWWLWISTQNCGSRGTYAGFPAKRDELNQMWCSLIIDHFRVYGVAAVLLAGMRPRRNYNSL